MVAAGRDPVAESSGCDPALPGGLAAHRLKGGRRRHGFERHLSALITTPPIRPD